MRYKPIEDYGVIGDLETVALVDRSGSMDLFCLPDIDSPTIFAALLDDKQGGRFEITTTIRGARHKQLYLPDTNILLTRFLCEDGIGEVTDFMPVGSMRNAHAVVRRVTAVRGPFSFSVRCDPRFDYGRAGHDVEAHDGVIVFLPHGGGGMALRLYAPVPLEIRDGAAVGQFTLDSGQTADFVLEAAGRDAGSPVTEQGWVDRAFDCTMAYWRDWISRSLYRGRWGDMVSRSALTMKLLTSARWGSIAAAATFGLPELVGGERNWDYRFTWIRDGAFTAACLIRLGLPDEARAFIGWVEDRLHEAAEPGQLQIMYGIDGRHELAEEKLDHLDGYRGSRPVRIGNAAYNQLQIDIYGELLYMIELFDDRVEPISYDMWRHLSHSIDWVCGNWQRQDEGIWEVRGGPREFLYSRLTSWLALDRAIRIASRRGLPAPIERWRNSRDEVHREIYHEFWNSARGAFVQSKGSSTLDASALLMPLVGFISSRDPRWLSTLRSIERELVDDALVYRYLTQEAASDGLTGTEGTFGMCSFWYIECVARAGDLERARLLFEKMHGYANHLGLFAEEMDITGRHLGNFPQAFTHLGLVSAALYLNDAFGPRGDHPGP